MGPDESSGARGGRGGRRPPPDDRRAVVRRRDGRPADALGLLCPYARARPRRLAELPGSRAPARRRGDSALRCRASSRRDGPDGGGAGGPVDCARPPDAPALRPRPDRLPRGVGVGRRAGAEAAGVGRRVAILAGLALPLATPLWGYAASDLSEPLQAASLAVLVAAAAALRLERKAGRGWEIAAGAAAGLALLTKSLLLLPALPLLLAASLRPAGSPRFRRLPPAVFAGCSAVWAALELSRFGRLFGGYAGEGFTHPLGDGLLRLLALPNRGLLFFAPLVLLAPAGFFTLRRRDALLAWAGTLSAGSLLGAVAMWWAWDGQVGWGPRLLVPILPVLVFLAAAAMSTTGGARRARRGREAVLGTAVLLGVAVNLLGALVPFPASTRSSRRRSRFPPSTGSTRPPRTLPPAPRPHPSWRPSGSTPALLAEAAALRRRRGAGRLSSPGAARGDLGAGSLRGRSVPGTRGLPVRVRARPGSRSAAFWGRAWIALLPRRRRPVDDGSRRPARSALRRRNGR